MMRYTIAICTYNRAALLERTLTSLSQLVGIQSTGIEVIVVDNHSTDTTAQVIEKWQAKLPLRYCHEPQQGHCFARNCAVAQAQGEVILWTDDDVQLDPDWLNAYRQAIESDPAATFWGGPIEPLFLSPPPRWVQQNWSRLAGCYAARDLGREPRELDADHLPYGANFAVRTEACRQFPFNTQLGRRGANLMGDDERDFLWRLLQAKHRGRWVPPAKLQHLIPPNRLTLHYVRDYFAGQAAVQCRGGTAPAFNAAQLAQAVRHHWLAWQFTRLYAPSPIWLDHWIKLAMFRQWQKNKAAESALANPSR